MHYMSPLTRSDGNKSKVHDCTKSKQGRCILLGRQKSGGMILWHLLVTGEENLAIELQNRRGWISKLSLYNVKSVRPCQVAKLVGWTEEAQTFSAIPRPYDTERLVAQKEADLKEIPLPNGPCGCSVTMKGEFEDDSEPVCSGDYLKDEDTGLVCCIHQRLLVKESIDHVLWIPSILSHIWQNGLVHEEVDLLQECGFVYDYNTLSWEHGLDARLSYGKNVNAVELVFGWRVKRIIAIVFAALVADCAMVAVIVSLSGKLEAGVAVGSYAVGIEAVLLALMTMLSFMIN